ncbi:MAG: hypothetical protein ABL973_13460 [Micropepsaceae bacterium]
MRFSLMAGLFGLVTFVPCVALAGEPPTGHWQGTYLCQGISQKATVDIWPDASEPYGLRGRFAFSPDAGGNTPTGSYYVSLEQTAGGWKLVPEQWEYQPQGYVMVAFSLYYTLHHLGGLVEDQLCMGQARTIGLDYAGESALEAVNDTPVGPDQAAGQGTGQYEQPDYMRRAEEERKAQNRANCERASKGANVSCSSNPY